MARLSLMILLECSGVSSWAWAQESSPWGVSLGAVTSDSVLTPIGLRLAAQCGIAWLRITFGTGVLYPTPGVFRFQASGYDRLVDSARAHGLNILGMILGSSWMTSAPSPDSLPPGLDPGDYPPRDLNAWAAYVDTLVQHYRDKIQYWEVWNEPDLPGFWFGTASQYAQLLAVTYNAIKQANPNAQVLLGGMALGGRRVDSDFLKKILTDSLYPAAQYFDIMNIHSYKPKAQAKITVDSVRALLVRYGAGSKPLWITETGYSSDSSRQPDPQYQGLQGQAQWLQDMITFLLDTVRRTSTKKSGAARHPFFSLLLIRRLYPAPRENGKKFLGYHTYY